MLNLANGFAARGLAVDLLLAQAEGPYLSEVRADIRVLDLSASRVLESLGELVRYYRREKPTALLSALDHANVVALWARRLAGSSAKIAVTTHTVLSISSGRAALRRDRLLQRLAARCYPWATSIIAVSQGVAEDLSQVTGIPRHTIHVIYNPIITHELKAQLEEPLDDSWFENGEPPVILSASRLESSKDLRTLLLAIAKVRETLQARLVILGQGPERTGLEALANRLGLSEDVSLPGFVRNPYRYMKNAAVYVQSSKSEGLPTVLIEALYCGATIVATDCPGGTREILAGGRYGSLVPIGDSESLARAIVKALSSPSQPPPKDSWQAFELDSVLDQYLELLL